MQLEVPQASGDAPDMDLKTLNITVCGGGIAGMASALALAQRGASVTVLERAPALEEVGAGLQVGPNGMAVLEALGLKDKIRALGTQPEAVELVDHRRGQRLMRVPLGGAAEQRWGRPYLNLHRADLLSVLAEAVQAAGVTVRLGTTVAGRKPNAVLLEDGTTLAADLIVAADGVRSALRKRMWQGEEVRFTGQVAWRALVSAERLGGWEMPRYTLLTLGPGKHVVLYRLREGALINVVAVEERETWVEEGWSIPGDPDELRRRFAGWNPVVERVLSAVESTYQWGLFEHPVLQHWVEDEVVLIGDAAHPMLPFLAQGAVMALEDAWVLADSLARERDLPSSLARYQTLRHPRGTRVQSQAARQARLYHARGPLRPGLHLGMSLVNSLLPDFAPRRFDWLYGMDVTA